MTKRTFGRRQFLQGVAATGTVYSLLPGRALGANDRVNIGVIGMGGRGRGHMGWFGKLANVEVVAVCDADTDRAAAAAAKGKGKDKGSMAKFQDMRKMLEMKDLDAVAIATPNHWHSLAAILACQAGKHVYVEKPVSHNIFEGRQMVRAARKYNRIVQGGTQQRSCPATQACARDVQAGKYGKVLWAHTSKLGARQPIGKVSTPTPVPAHIDYDLWCGPAPKTPVMRKNFHYDWHWQWNWGDGEMGNWAVHYLDDLCHIMGWDDLPDNVIAAGNRWWDDDGETPNMHMALMEHKGVKVVVDIRNMADPKGGKGGAVYLGSRGGNYIMCEEGYIKIARGGGKAYDKNGKAVKQYKGNGGGAHAGNFINAIREGSNKSLNCEIEEGHCSTALCHLANISYRVGKDATPDVVQDSLKHHEDAVNTIESMLTQLDGNNVDLKQQPFILGPKLRFDPKAERFTGEHASLANALAKGTSRAPFVVPEKV